MKLQATFAFHDPDSSIPEFRVQLLFDDEDSIGLEPEDIPRMLLQAVHLSIDQLQDLREDKR